MHFSDYVVDYALQVNNQSLRALTGVGDELSPAVVHGLRVNVKRLRAAWQIVRHVSDRWVVTDAKRRLAVIHRSLAPSRDADVIDRTIAKLTDKRAGGKTEKALKKLQAALGIADREASDAAGRGLIGADVVSLVAAGFQRESRCWRELNLVDMADDELIARGFGGPFRAGRRLGRRYAAGGSEKLLHRWRKYAKHSLYQLEVVKPALGDPNLARRWYLERLTDCLGTHQDLCMVQRAVATVNLKPGARRRIDDAVVERKTTLESRAMKLYAHLYGMKTGQFVDSLAVDINQLALEDIIWLPSRMAG